MSMLMKKFGKQIQKRQLENPEYAASFVNYKALKKLIKKLSTTPLLDAQNDPHQPAQPADSQAALQANKATFFFQLERELEKVNAFYLQKEAELRIRLKTLLDKKRVLQSRNDISRRSAKFTTLEEGFQQFANDLNKLQQFVEVNGTAFSKILKKWDKTSKSKTKELYLSRAVEVQPFFNATVISELSDQATTSLQELGAWAEGDRDASFDGGRADGHVVSSRHVVGTDESDADSLLLDTVISGNIESLRDLLVRTVAAAGEDPSPQAAVAVPGKEMATATSNALLVERVTRTFLSAVNEAPREALQVLLETGLVDITSEDDINERNCLHQATIYGNSFVLGVGLSRGVSVSRTDVYGRIPLHYASMHGRLDMINALLDVNDETIDLTDHDNFTPLIHAIIHGHLECVETLLARKARLDPVSDTDHVPLNLACEHGSEAIVELLLKHGAKIQADAEGLYPQHLVARSMQPPQLLLLLKRYGADLDQVDKLYGWTPLVHAASEGNVACLQALLDSGADPGIVDEKDLPALYYAAWEGHLECMELLRPYNKRTHASRPLKPQPAASPQLLGSGRSAGPMAVDPDAIPVLELPPPIIPLRRYGHNFLDTKTLVQISFEDAQPLVFFHDGKYPAARLTISSKASDLIPKNIILPFQEDTRLVSFQVDNIDAFTLDLDVFPTYGAKVIAKTVALPNTFRFAHVSSGRVCLPLFDPRLRAIGQISFDTHVVKPFQGRPLEITAFETYWKATSQLDSATDGGGISSSATAATVAAAASFITGSSLSGDFVQLFVQHTSDAVPVLWPTWTVPCGDGVDVPISRLTHAQFAAATSRLPNREHLSSLPSLPLERVADAHALLATTGVTLAEALAILPPGMNVNLNVIYPSAEEERTLGLGPTPDINVAVDAVLAVVFDHARAQRASGGSDKVMRGVVFTSYNPMVCTALNWKQPNFPVFLCNDLGAEEEKQKVGGTVAVQSTFGFIRSSGRRTSSIKEVVRVAVSNNFMGLICSSRLLDMVPAIADFIKSNGLALVVDRSCDAGRPEPQGGPMVDPFPRLPSGIDGLLEGNGVLRFNESIDV